MPGELLSKGLELFTSGDIAGAARAWLQARQTDPDSPQIAAYLNHLKALEPQIFVAIAAELAAGLSPVEPQPASGAPAPMGVPMPMPMPMPVPVAISEPAHAPTAAVEPPHVAAPAPVVPPPRTGPHERAAAPVATASPTQGVPAGAVAPAEPLPPPPPAPETSATAPAAAALADKDAPTEVAPELDLDDLAPVAPEPFTELQAPLRAADPRSRMTGHAARPPVVEAPAPIAAAPQEPQRPVAPPVGTAPPVAPRAAEIPPEAPLTLQPEEFPLAVPVAPLPDRLPEVPLGVPTAAPKPLAAPEPTAPGESGAPPIVTAVTAGVETTESPWGSADDGVTVQVASDAPALGLLDRSVEVKPTTARSALIAMESRLRELFGLDDLTGAVAVADEILEAVPDHSEAGELRGIAAAKLQKMYESKIGDKTTVPRVLLSPEDLIWLDLDHRSGFVLAQIDGSSTYEEIVEVTGMDRLESYRIMAKLVQKGVIGPQ